MNKKMLWPEGKRIAVMMAFDLDAEALWDANHNQADTFFRGIGSYGPVQGMPRILNLMHKHDIPATFFIPGITAERYPEVVKEIARCGHEIAFHGYTHNCWPTKEEEDAAMTRSEQIIFNLTGQKLIGQRAPDGDVFDFTVELLREHGYIYSSNWRNDDGPFLHKVDGKEIPFVELPKDSIFDDTTYDMYVDRPYQTCTQIRNAREMTQIWKDEFDALADEGRMINFVIHPQFIGHISRIDALDGLIAYMKENGAWFATNADVARYVLRQRGYNIDV